MIDKTTNSELEELLNDTYLKFNCERFIQDDPVQIPHLFTSKEDVEISGFLTATIAWGNRKAILKSAHLMMEMMDNAPYDFVMNAEASDLNQMQSFYYRTFQGVDFAYFISALQNVYQHHGGLETVMTHQGTVEQGLTHLREVFFANEHLTRTEKHLASIVKGASCKRLCMYLRWMVRDDNGGVDFGIWKELQPSQLFLPLDVHTGNVARHLGLLTRKANDWKSVMEVTDNLRLFDVEDPVKYDFSLFGMGVEGYFK